MRGGRVHYNECTSHKILTVVKEEEVKEEEEEEEEEEQEEEGVLTPAEGKGEEGEEGGRCMGPGRRAFPTNTMPPPVLPYYKHKWFKTR